MNWLKLFGIAVLIVLCGLGGCCTFNCSFSDKARADFIAAKSQRLVDDYLAAARDGDAAAVTQLMRPGFKLQGNLSWAELWLATGHPLAQSAQFARTTSDSEGARFTGELITSNGGAIPVEFEFEHRLGATKIAQMTSSYAAAAQPVPDPATTTELFRSALILISSAIESGNFRDIFARHSITVKKQASLQAYAEAWTSKDSLKSIDWKVVRQLARATTPSVSRHEQGLLQLEGTLAMTPKPLKFTVLYNFEAGQWCIAGLTAQFAD